MVSLHDIHFLSSHFQNTCPFESKVCILLISNVLCLIPQLCLTLCKPMDCSPSGSSICGILQARILEWVAMPSSRGFSQPWDQMQVSCIEGELFTIWATRKAHECWSDEPIQFSRASSQPRNWAGISCIAGGFLTSELPGKLHKLKIYK